MHDVSTAMATILRHLYQATIDVERVFVDRWLDFELALPGTEPDDVVVRGGWPWFEEGPGSLRFHCLSVSLPHPYEQTPNGPSEFYVYLDLSPHDGGFTVTAAVTAYLEQAVYDLPAGEHHLVRHVEQETTVDGAVAAIGRCRDLLMTHDDLFERVGFPLRQR